MIVQQNYYYKIIYGTVNVTFGVGLTYLLCTYGRRLKYIFLFSYFGIRLI